MASNTNIQIADLDFDRIKSSLKTYLKGQSTFQDYDFEGSALSTLIDILAYNTHYQAYYMNMLANEMFLDTAQLRSSAISHAKLLNYTPTSVSAPYAEITLQVNGVTDASSVTLPIHTKFQSESIDGSNYTYVTYDSKTVNVTANTATFSNLGIYQGEPVSYQFEVDNTANPSQIFTLPDTNIDTSTIKVTVQTSSTNSAISTYTKSVDHLSLTSTSKVYFLQEASDGYFEIYFGDGVLGKSLNDGNIVNVSYIVTSASASRGANNFVLLDNIGYANTVVIPVIASSAGSDRETIDSIRYTAPKSYAAQNRAVTKDDYIVMIKKASTEYPIDAVTVWGGEEEARPVFGKVYISIKPTGKYLFTTTEKQHISNEVIKPMSVLTVIPEIVDPDYTYIKVTCDVEYDATLTTKTSQEIKTTVTNAIKSYTSTTLNTFNATFSLPNMLKAVSDSDIAITSANIEIELEKRFTPSIAGATTQTFNFGTQLRIGTSGHALTVSPSYKVVANVLSIVSTVDDAFMEEKLDANNTVQSTGKIQSYYYNSGQKIIISENAGTINYANGDVVLTSFAPTAVNNDLGVMKVFVTPESHIIKSTKNRILTLDDTDSTAIVVNITAKQ